MRGVLIQDAEKCIVAVMNTRSQGWQQAVDTAMLFVEAANNKAKLDEALETIRDLRLELSARKDYSHLVNEALYPDGVSKP
jgi:hypothetical protein